MTKPRSICLCGHEARALQRDGRVLLVRAVKPQPECVDGRWTYRPKGSKFHEASGCWIPSSVWADPLDPMQTGAAGIARWSPFGGVGTRLWCREKWRCNHLGGLRIEYAAGGSCLEYEDWPKDAEPPYALPTSVSQVRRVEKQLNKEKIPDEWRSSTQMPRWASRLTVEIAGVSVKRCREITEEEAIAAGYNGDCPVGYIPAYEKSPRVYHFAYENEKAWESNAWLWLGDARRVECFENA